MSQLEILEELKKLSPEELVETIKAALRLVQKENLQAVQESLSEIEISRRLIESAQLLQADYAPGGELRIFTELDSEDFYDYEEVKFGF